MIAKNLKTILPALSPSPRRGEGWGEGETLCGLPPHPSLRADLSPRGEAEKASGFGGLMSVIAFAAAMSVAGVANAADHVKISYVVPTMQYAAMLVAVDKGYFAEENLDPELVQAGGGVATPALISGDIQFSGSPSASISASIKGAHLKVLFVGEDHSAFQIWAQPGVEKFEDLKGKAIGIISRGDTTEIIIRYMLDKRNLPADYLSYAPLGTGTARMAALASGAYPAALIDVAEVRDMENAGKLSKLHLMYDLRKEDVRMTFGGYATSDSVIAKNPESVRHFLRGLLKGLAVVKASKEETVKALVNHGSTKPGAEDGWDVFAASISPTGVVPPDAQAFEIRVRGEMLGVDAGKLPKASDVFAESFTEKAAAELKAEGWKPKL